MIADHIGEGAVLAEVELGGRIGGTVAGEAVNGQKRPYCLREAALELGVGRIGGSGWSRAKGRYGRDSECRGGGAPA